MGAPWLWSGVLVGAAMMLALVSPGRTPHAAAHAVMTLSWDREDHRATRTTAYDVVLSSCRAMERQVHALREAGDGRIAVSCMAVEDAAAAGAAERPGGNG